MGNDNTISDRSNVISFGHQNTISASNAVAIGNGADVSVEGGVALGVGSVADRAAEVVGYDPATGAEYVIPEDDAASYVWKATKGAVSVGSARETRQITNVAAGTEDTDAVNVAQLKKVSEAAANANKGWKLKTTGGTESVVAPGATVEFDGDDNIQVGNVGNKVSVTLKNQLTGIQSITGAGEGSIKFNNKVTIDNNGKISGVANGVNANDAVNVSQLNAAKTEVVKGTNIASVGETTATDGHTVYTVNAKGTSVSADDNFKLNTTTDAETNVTNYGISLNDSVTIGRTHAVTINGTDGTVTGLTNTTWNKDSITSGRAATEDQLQAVATEAGKHTTLSNGKNTTVESTVKDGQTDYKVNVAGDLTDITSVANGDSKINLNKDSIIISNGNKYFAITNSGIGMSYIGADYSAKSIMLGENGTTISGGLNVAGSKITGVAAGEADTDAVNVSQLQKVSDTANAGWNLSTNGVATEATNVKPGDYVDFSGDDNIKVSNDGTKVQVKLNENIDVNSIQTNALNAKYNLSVGTMAENGIMPFLVNSTGAFYAANNNFSVDKYGKVIATAGEIGNVVLQNGVYTGNSALSDGELYLGDASGNYSQITPKSAKLGQVTIDEKGNMAGVNSIQTNALNAKYNLSVGTMAENGIMPFLVNSTGAFYAANNNFSVDKYGKVIATAGEIGNVVLQNGVYTGNSALSDGELYVGDASGNYSQITTTGAKLGQVTIAADGKISGVAAGEADTDAVNVSQLKKVSDTANAGWNLSTNGVATEATNVKPGDYVDFSGDDNIKVSNDGTKVQVKLNENIDVNSIQTNALNAKYNLSVGTMAENGIMPFLVSSTGAFYAANNNFSVDKDGKVTATEGEIGNVVLKNGVLYKNTALRDGELYVGDADGNYSQITTKGAKLGKVTVAADGKISGVAAGEVSSTSTDAINGSQLHAVATEAGKHTTLSNGKNTTVESTVKDGQTDYKVNVAGDLTDITSVANGDSKINLNKDSIIISNGNKYFAITNSGIGMSYIGADYSAKSIMLGENGTTISGGLNVAGSKITGVAAGVADTDAVNVGQLKEAVQAGNTDTHIKPGEYGVGADNKVNMDVVDKNGNKVDTVTIKDVAKASDVGNVNNIASDIKNKEGKTTVVDAVNNLNDKVGNLQYSKVEKGEIADGDSTTTAIGKLDQKLTDVAATAAKHTKVEGSSNITVNNTAKEGEAANYKVELNKDIDVDTVTANSVTTGQTVMNNDGLKVGENVSVTGTAVTAGQASISNEGLAVGPNTSLKADELKVDGKNYIDKDGLNANGQHITNVKAGEADTDAVNYGQLKDTNNHIDRVENQVVNNTNRISNLDNRVNKVGAGAAALAALHPLDFDPDAKWDFAAGYGNYRGANAAAVGAYYRPNEDTMFSVGGTFGNGENMVNAGVSFKLGSGSSHVSTSRVAMAKEIKELRGELEAMKSAMLDANAGKKIDTSKLQLFPDVPQNHWAYEYVAQLAGNGMIEGYPDGNFAGDRPMTRYEFAAILYRAMTKGAVLSDKILSEFSHELEYFTVDTIAKDKAGNPTIQRVRTVKENKNK